MKSLWIRILPSFIRERLEKRVTLQEAMANTGWLFADHILRMGVGLFVGIWVARYLGPDQFGAFSYALAFVALFSAFATLGLDTVVVRDIVRDPDSAKEILGTAFILKLLGGVFVVAITVTLLWVMRPADAITRWMVGIIAAGSVFQACNTIDLYFQSQVRSKYTVYARDAAFILASLGKVVLILFNASLLAFAWIALFEVAVGSLGLIVIYRLKGHLIGMWHKSLGRARKLLQDSWPLILSGFVIMVYMRIDQVMLGELSTNSEVGNYSAAVRLVEAWYFIPLAITTSLFPVLVESKNLEKTVYEARMQKLYDLMIWMAICIALLISAFSGFIIATLYGEGFSGAAPILTLQAWMATAVFFSVARQKWLVSEGWIKDGMHVNVVAVLLNIVANAVLIPQYKAVGASIASLITAFGANFVVAVYSKPIRHSIKMYGIGLLLPARFIKKKLSAVS